MEIARQTWAGRVGHLVQQHVLEEGSFLRKSIRNKPMLMGGIISIIILFVGFLPGLVAPHPFHEINMTYRLLPPAWAEGGNWSYLFGTDVFGRDLLSRIIYGTRVILVVAVVANVISTVLGVGLGVLAGYIGGATDKLITRVADVAWAFPGLLLSIAIMAVFGPSIPMLWVVLTVTGWVGYTRVIRGVVLTLKVEDYVTAAKAVGASSGRIMLRHILPNLVAPITVLMSFRLGTYILAEGSLSFIGLGVPPPNPSWGGLLSEGRAYITTSWWLITFPGIAMMLGVLAANLLGDGLRDVMDPRMRGTS